MAASTNKCTIKDCACKDQTQTIHTFTEVHDNDEGYVIKVCEIARANIEKDLSHCDLCKDLMKGAGRTLSKNLTICCHCQELGDYTYIMTDVFKTPRDLLCAFPEYFKEPPRANIIRCDKCVDAFNLECEDFMDHFFDDRFGKEFTIYLNTVFSKPGRFCRDAHGRDLVVKASHLLVANYTCRYFDKQADIKDKEAKVEVVRKRFLRATIPALQVLSDSEFDMYVPAKRVKLSRHIPEPFIDEVIEELESTPLRIKRTNLLNTLRLLFE